jgi:hypothetical protein
VNAAEIDEVGDGLEGIVDFVRDGGGEAADGSEFFAFDEGVGFAAALDDFAASLDERHGLAAEGFEGGALGGVERARALVDDAEGSEHAAVGRDERGAGVEADAGVAEHEGIIRKARIEESVFDDQGLAVLHRVGADALGARGAVYIDAARCLEPLAIFSHEGDECDRCAADMAGDLDEVVVALLRAAVENFVLLERAQTIGFVDRNWGWRHNVERDDDTGRGRLGRQFCGERQQATVGMALPMYGMSSLMVWPLRGDQGSRK